MARIFSTIALALFFMMGVAGAFDAIELPNPADNLDVGQWASYSIMGATQKQTVVKIEGEGDERMVTIAFESFMDDQTNRIERVISVMDLMPDSENLLADGTAVSRETRTIGGREIDVIVLSADGEDGLSKLVVSHAVPISAVVSMEVGGAEGMGVVMQLTDFSER